MGLQDTTDSYKPHSECYIYIFLNSTAKSQKENQFVLFVLSGVHLQRNS